MNFVVCLFTNGFLCVFSTFVLQKLDECFMKKRFVLHVRESENQTWRETEKERDRERMDQYCMLADAATTTTTTTTTTTNDSACRLVVAVS